MNDDESTAPSQQIINTDHIVVTTPPVAYEDTDAPSLPPLDSIDAGIIAEQEPRRKGNSRSFQVANTVRKDSTQQQREVVEQDGIVLHPVKMAEFGKYLQQTNVRRIPEGEVECRFREGMKQFLLDRVGKLCWSQRHKHSTKCTCLKELLARDDQNVNVLADMVTSFYQLKSLERQSILTNKVFSIIDNKVTAKLKSISSMKFRGRLFHLRGKFNHSENLNASVSNYPVCLYAYLSIYGVTIICIPNIGNCSRDS